MKLGKYAVLLLITVIFGFPFYWMLVSSLKAKDVLVEYPPTFLPYDYLRVSLPVRKLRVGVAGERRLAVYSFSKDIVYGFVIKSGELSAEMVELPHSELTLTAKTVTMPSKRVRLVKYAGAEYSLLGLRDKPPTAFLERRGEVITAYPSLMHPIRVLMPRWQNYISALTTVPFGTFFRNSFFIAICATVGQLLSSSLAGFAFARIRFKGREFFFVILLCTMMVPGQVLMVLCYIGFRTAGWVDSFLPLIVPQFFAGAFNTFLLRQFFLTIPRELDEAAEIDGCGKFGVYWRIILPLSKPALVVVGVFTFLWHWKDLMGPLLYLDSRAKHTVTLGLEYMRNPHELNAHVLMSASACVMLPTVILFIVAQRYLVGGIALTGLKR